MVAIMNSTPRRRFPPWPTRAEHEAHLVDDARVHGETTTSLSTILAEVRKGNADTAALREAVAPLVPVSADLARIAAERKFRLQLAGLVVTAGKGIGWFAAFAGAIAGVMAISPGFTAWLKWLL